MLQTDGGLGNPLPERPPVSWQLIVVQLSWQVGKSIYTGHTTPLIPPPFYWPRCGPSLRGFFLAPDRPLQSTPHPGGRKSSVVQTSETFPSVGADFGNLVEACKKR